jgi:PAS domain S-box-containing protein
MYLKPHKVSEEEYDRLLLVAVDETLSSLGDGAKAAIYFHIEQKFNIKRSEIAYRFEDFSQALRKLFGMGSKPIEAMIMRRLNAKVQCEPGEDVAFPKNLVTVNEEIVARDETQLKPRAIGTSVPSNGTQPKESGVTELLNLIADPVSILDVKGNVLFLNTATEAGTGCKCEDWIGRSFSEMPTFTKASKTLAMQNLARRMAGETVEPYEIEVFDPQGNPHKFEVNAKIISYAGQKAILVICHDVTLRRKYELQLKGYAENLEWLVEKKTEEIRDNEERMRGIFESSPDGIMVTGLDFRVSNCNQALVDLLGFDSKNSILGKSGFALIGEKDRNAITEIVTKSLQDGAGTTKNIEYTFVNQKGKEVTLEFSVASLKNSNGKFAGYLASAKDVTERLSMQEKLLTSEKKHKRLSHRLEVEHEDLLAERNRAQHFLEIADVMLLALDLKGNITLLNREGCSIIGCKTDEAIGQNWFETFVPEEARAERKRMHQLRLKDSTNRREHAENVILRTDGQKRIISWRHTVVRNSKGRAVGTLSSGEDVTEQKQLLEDLQASEERFRAISTSAMDSIVLMDEQDIVTYWNPAAERIFGFTTKEAVGKKLATLIVPPRGRKTHKELIKDLVQNPSKKSFERTALRKDGTEFPIDLSLASIKLKNKTCVLSITRDVSERKAMEEQITRERDMLESITESIGVGLGIVDRDYNIVWVNNHMKNQLGEIVGKPCYSTYNTLQAPCPGCGPKKVFEGASFDSREFFNKGLQDKGRPSWYELITTPIKDEKGNVTAAIEVTVDITEKKQLQENLREERNKFEAVTENINAGLILIDRDYKVIWTNNYSKRMYGDIVGKVCHQALQGRDSVCPFCGVQKVFEGAPMDARENAVKCRGETRIMEVTVTPMRDQDGKVVAALELGMDITELKRMQSELSKYSEKLEELVEERTEQLKETQTRLVKSERLAAIGELAGMVGHDLRNPLTSIKGAAYFLKSKYMTQMDVLGKDMLLTIDRSIDYSNKIINDLLDYSRDMKLELSEATPKLMMKTAASLIEIPEKVKFVDATSESPIVEVDTGKMSRVFLNLIRNALDAMPTGGTLTVTSRKIKDNWEVTFQDTGVGMDMSTLSKLWTPLFTTKAKGMGFGLAICKRIVEVHGGKIAVESAPRKGTLFTVTLPIHPKLASEAEKKWVFNPTSLVSIEEPRT